MFKKIFILFFLFNTHAFATQNSTHLTRDVSPEVLIALQERIQKEQEELYIQCLIDEECSKFIHEYSSTDSNLALSGTLNSCLRACSRGQSAIEAFCRTIPLPQIRIACWANRYSAVACSGFCYACYD